MLQIKKMRADHTIDFAAEELKKYLRMMMPEIGEIDICYEPQAQDGFRLGIFEDFGMTSETEDPMLDDVVHVDTDEKGGILAGSNPRSVLFAVYRLLKLNGCRFLFPGTDGEYIPRKNIKPAQYHKLADHRLRGHTTEGDPSLEQVLDYIDYMAKQEQNVYGVFGIFAYHRRYYRHRYNEANRTPESLTFSLAEQWKGLCEAELMKRGIMVQDADHGWVPQAIGFKEEDRYLYKEGKKEVPEELIKYLAMINGKRGLYQRDPHWTGLCLSQKEVRSKIVKLVADHAVKNRQYITLAVPRQDGSHNYCECEECQKLRPSDYLVMMCNELDDLLTERGIDTKLTLSTYVDCMFPPIREKIKNPSRFLLKYIPISRSYTSSFTEDTIIPAPTPYVYNDWERPKRIEDYIALFKEWQKAVPISSFCYEYHYWVHQYRDPGMLAMARRIYEDTRSLKLLGIDGCTEDGSNKSFFPNGFQDYIFGETLVNRECDYDAVLADYFYHIYGEDWEWVKSYLERISTAFDHRYMCGELGVLKEETKRGASASDSYYNPAHAANIARVKELAAEAREMVSKHMSMPTRPQTVCWRLLLRHAEYCERLAEVMTAKCLGHHSYAKELFNAFLKDFGKYDFELERYFDFGLAADSIEKVLNKRDEIEQ